MPQLLSEEGQAVPQGIGPTGHKDPLSKRLVCSLLNKEQLGMSSDKGMEGHLESVTAQLGLATQLLTHSHGKC